MKDDKTNKQEAGGVWLVRNKYLAGSRCSTSRGLREVLQSKQLTKMERGHWRGRGFFTVFVKQK